VPDVQLPKDNEGVLVCTWKSLFDTWMDEVRWPILQQATGNIWSKVKWFRKKDEVRTLLTCFTGTKVQILTHVPRKKQKQHKQQQQQQQAAAAAAAAAAVDTHAGKGDDSSSQSSHSSQAMFKRTNVTSHHILFNIQIFTHTHT
jgi:hypothetical protein